MQERETDMTDDDGKPIKELSWLGRRIFVAENDDGTVSLRFPHIRRTASPTTEGE